MAENPSWFKPGNTLSPPPNPESFFKPGNQLWRLSPTVKERFFANGEALIAAAIEYFEWADVNPLEQTVVGWYQGEASDHTIYHPRTLTVAGLCAYVGVDRQNWSVWKRDRDDLRLAIEWVEQIMFEQKFSGAAVGLFNASIIARDLGLADVQDHRSGDGSMTPKPNIIEFVAPQLEAPEEPNGSEGG